MVSDALQLYFRLRHIGTERPTDEERALIAEGKLACEEGELSGWTSGDVPWDLVITKPAERGLRKLSSNDLRRVDIAFETMRNSPYSGDIKFLANTGGTLRRRAEAWRIFLVEKIICIHRAHVQQVGYFLIAPKFLHSPVWDRRHRSLPRRSDG
jgi:hypothetical protein